MAAEITARMQERALVRRESRDHDFTLDEWIRELERLQVGLLTEILQSDSFTLPLPPTVIRRDLSKEQRSVIYSQRYDRGCAIFHPLDARARQYVERYDLTPLEAP